MEMFFLGNTWQMPWAARLATNGYLGEIVNEVENHTQLYDTDKYCSLIYRALHSIMKITGQSIGATVAGEPVAA